MQQQGLVQERVKLPKRETFEDVVGKGKQCDSSALFPTVFPTIPYINPFIKAICRVLSANAFDLNSS